MRAVIWDAILATIALLICALVMVLLVLAERRGAQTVRDEAVAAGVAEYRLDSPTNATATFHWRMNR